jgi:hypothetical protein
MPIFYRRLGDGLLVGYARLYILVEPGRSRTMQLARSTRTSHIDLVLAKNYCSVFRVRLGSVVQCLNKFYSRAHQIYASKFPR